MKNLFLIILITLFVVTINAQTYHLDTDVRVTETSTENLVENIDYKISFNQKTKFIFFDNLGSTEDFSYKDMLLIERKEYVGKKGNLTVLVYQGEVDNTASDIIMLLFEDGDLKAVKILPVAGSDLSYYKTKEDKVSAYQKAYRL